VTIAAELSPALAPVVSIALGVVAAIENLRALTGGASRSTWAFDAVTPEERRALILRIGPPDDVHASMELEARVQAVAAAAGTPVPHVLVADNSAAALGNPFLICEEVEGETIARRIDRQLEKAGGQTARSELLSQCAQALAAIHRADADDPELATQDQLAEWRSRLDAMGDTTATFEWAFRWLAANRPAPSPPHLVHGDYRMGNLIVDGSDLAAVLTGSWFTSVRSTKTWPGSASGPGGSAHQPTAPPAGWQRRGFSLRLRTGRRDCRRSGSVSLVAGAGYAALGCHLPLPGRAPPERTDPLGGAGRDRPPSL